MARRSELLADPGARLDQHDAALRMPERELDRGGSALDYLAHDVKHDYPVALKVFRPNIAAVGSKRFLQEIQITARLQHPFILPLCDSGKADSLPPIT